MAHCFQYLLAQIVSSGRVPGGGKTRGLPAAGQLIALLVALLFSGAVRAQPVAVSAQPRFGALTTQDGLMMNTVYAICQDQRGFMWLGTQNGLNRYDGTRFLAFRHQPENPHSLATGAVRALAATPDGRWLWVGLDGGGLCALDLLTHRVQRYATGQVTALASAPGTDGAVWVATRGAGLRLVKPATHAVTTDTAGASLPPLTACALAPRWPATWAADTLTAITVGADGTVWVGTQRGGLRSRAAGGGPWQAFRHDPRTLNSLPANRVTALLRGRDGQLYVATAAGVAEWEPAARRFRRLPVSPPGADALHAQNLSQDFQGRLWVGTYDQGLWALAPRSGAVLGHFFAAPPPGAAPTYSVAAEPSVWVWSSWVDRGGVLWLGTYGTGVLTLSAPHNRFRTFSHDPRDPTSLSNNGVVCLAEQGDGRLWVGTYGNGLNELNRETGRFRTFTANPADPTALAHRAVLALAPDLRTGALWVGTDGGGLHQRLPNGPFRRFPHDPRDARTLPSNELTALAFDSAAACLWVGSHDAGLARFDPATATSRRYVADGGPGTAHVACLLLDGPWLWVGTRGAGLWRLNRHRGTWRTYPTRPLDSTALSYPEIRTLWHDAATGLLWVGTNGGGLCALNPTTGRCRRYGLRQGLPDNVIYGILPDSRVPGQLWVSTNAGLCAFRPPASGRPTSARTYTAADGLLSNEFNGGAAARTRDGTLFFGGVNGLTALAPTALRPDPYAPPPVITEISVLNQVLTPGPEADPDAPHLRHVPEATDTLYLRFAQNVLTLRFAALGYATPASNRLAHRLAGFEHDWVTAPASRPEATYTNLSPGRYCFQVRAANADGRWHPRQACLWVVVAPPWWRTSWFYGLSALSVGAVLFGLDRLRVRRLRDRENLRTRIARDLHDDVGSTLSSISLLSSAAALQAAPGGEAVVARELMDRVSDSAQRMLGALGDVVWAIDPANDSMTRVVARMRAFASQLLEAQGLELTMTVDDAAQSATLPMEARRNLFLLFKEVLNNVARHAAATRVSVALTISAAGPSRRQLTLTVRDDGRGFDPAAARAPGLPGGHGLPNLRARAAALGATLALTTAPGQGTTVQLTLPLRAS